MTGAISSAPVSPQIAEPMKTATLPSNLSPGTPSPSTAPTGDAKEHKPSFQEVWGKIQSQMGAKPLPQREIKKTLDKDDFLRIMITQLKNQDPTKPFEAEKLATEIAQIASVEQLTNVNKALTQLSTQNRPLEKLTMTNLIGKTVTLDRSRFPHTKGNRESLTYQLPEDAENVKIAIVSEKGEVVREEELGVRTAGGNEYSWDGKKKNSISADAGNYFFRVEAFNKRGGHIQIQTQNKSQIVGVSFSGPEPVFLVGDAKHQDPITLNNIIRIDDAPSGNPVAIARPEPGEVRAQENPLAEALKPSKFIPINSLIKDTDSEEVSHVTPSPAKSLAQIEPEEKGFPHGLGGDSEIEANPKGGEKK